MEKEKKINWSRVWKIVGVALLVIVGISVIGSSSNSTASGNNPSGEGSGDLNATVVPLATSIMVTNNETIDWTDCMVGVNGGTGWGFDNPPYKTRTQITFPAGTDKIIPDSSMSMDDGTIFDPTTHAINSIVVDCGGGTTNERSWVGTPPSSQ
jgi:hypothetical protein